MIEFTDITLRETQGFKDEVESLMKEEVMSREWMLRTEAFVTSQFAAAKYVLHFWKNGDVVIFDTDRPLKIDVPDDDLRELSEWCLKTGWNQLKVDDRLLAARGAMDFWNRAFITGLVMNDELAKKENDEMERLMKVHDVEKEDEDAS